MRVLIPRRRTRGAFTLIELLVVIAIIAILTAILMPVIMAAKEKSRQGVVLDHYRQISDALAKYKLDHHQFPPVLFGYAKAGTAMADDTDPSGGGLYPSYITDPSVFTDPNNPVADNTSTTMSASKSSLTSTGSLTTATDTFYAADAFDANPAITSPGTLGTTPVTRYQLAWTAFPPPAGKDGTRELAYPNPSADTYVTCTTYHAGSGIGQDKVIVLFEGGNTEVMDDRQFVAAAGGTDGPGSTFWEVKP